MYKIVINLTIFVPNRIILQAVNINILKKLIKVTLRANPLTIKKQINKINKQNRQTH